MCFSAPVSFSAAVILALAGLASLRQVRHSSQIFFASIPLIFAIQQFFEGVLWLNLGDGKFLEGLGLLSAYIFLTFAMLFWPIWIPLSLLFLEKIKWRKWILLGFLFAGIAWSSFFLWIFPKTDIQIGILENSIHYYADVPISKFYYTTLIVCSCLISSFPRVWYFGVLVGISILITDYFYNTVFISVWCFFCALMSLVIYHILKTQNLVSQDQEFI